MKLPISDSGFFDHTISSISEPNNNIKQKIIAISPIPTVGKTTSNPNSKDIFEIKRTFLPTSGNMDIMPTPTVGKQTSYPNSLYIFEIKDMPVPIVGGIDKLPTTTAGKSMSKEFRELSRTIYNTRITRVKARSQIEMQYPELGYMYDATRFQG